MSVNPVMRILLVEDDHELGTAMREALVLAGYTTDWVKTAGYALHALQFEHFDLLVLDLGLPDCDGTEIIRTLRALRKNLPILILTARDSLESRIEGLDLGGDDYVVKPVAMAELCARIRALLRRKVGDGNALWSLGSLELDIPGKIARIGNEALELTAREWSLLACLANSSGRIVSKEQLIQVIGGWDQELSANAIEACVHRVRSKLNHAGVTIRTVRGLGYMLSEQNP
jgi:two-component system OmpR family response regulator